MNKTLVALAAAAAMTFAGVANADQIDGTKITTSSQSGLLAGMAPGVAVGVVVVGVAVVAAVVDAIDSASGT